MVRSEMIFRSILFALATCTVFNSALSTRAIAQVATASAPPKSPLALFDEAVQRVETTFFDASGAMAFQREADRRRSGLGASPFQATIDAVLDTLLAELKTSHTGRWTPAQIAYYEQLAIYGQGGAANPMHTQLRAHFPPDGIVRYDGIGITPRQIGGRTFIVSVYDGGPAAHAGLRTGDEIVAVSGQPYREIASFASRAGQPTVSQCAPEA